MLVGFGTFWAGEGVGIDWPAGDAAILALLVGYAALALVGVQVVRIRRSGRVAGLSAAYSPAAVPPRGRRPLMRHLRAFAAFWHDFLVDDRPVLFLGPIAALVIVWLTTNAGMPGPAAGLLLFALVAGVGGASIVWAIRR